MLQFLKTFLSRSSSPQFGSTVELWFEHIRPQKKAHEVIAQVRRDLLPRWQHKPLNGITRRDVIEAIDCARRRGPSCARHCLSYATRFFTWAEQRGLIDRNPCAGIKPSILIGPEPKGDRVLSLDELAAIWKATSSLDNHDRIVRLLILTGQRRCEIGGLEWSEINLAAKQIELPAKRCKNGRPHIVPLTDLAISLLPERREGHRHLFGKKPRQPFSGWSQTKRRLNQRLGADFAPWTLHDLRRSFVTHLNELGIAEPHIVEAIVNHVSGVKGGVAGIYNRAAYLPERRKALEAWSGVISSLRQPVTTSDCRVIFEKQPMVGGQNFSVDDRILSNLRHPRTRDRITHNDVAARPHR